MKLNGNMLSSVERRRQGWHHSRSAGEEGFVLPVVIFAVVLLIAIAVATLSTSTDERMAGRALRESARAFYAAEAGLNAAISGWDQAAYDTLLAVPGDSLALGWQTLDNGSSYGAVVHRVDGGSGTRLYIVTVTGRGPGALHGQRILRTLMRVNSFTINVSVPGAVTMVDGPGGPLSDAAGFTGNNFVIQGQDSPMPSASDPANIPAGCSATASGDNKLGISLTSQESADKVTFHLGGQEDQVKGLLPGSTTNEYTDTGSWGINNGDGEDYNITADELQALVDALMPSATSVPTGNYNDDLGTPTDPGVFVVDGDINLQGNGLGYGILIVTGHLSMAGQYKWEGLMLVVGDGEFNIGGVANEVHGAILAANTRGGPGRINMAGQGGVYYSSQALCRVEQQALEAGGARPLSKGGWWQVVN